MSLGIDVETITEVLLPDGKWYLVEPGSFDVDSYEMISGDICLLGGGDSVGTSSTGFRFREYATAEYISGPMTSVIAVREQNI